MAYKTQSFIAGLFKKLDSHKVSSILTQAGYKVNSRPIQELIDNHTVKKTANSYLWDTEFVSNLLLSKGYKLKIVPQSIDFKERYVAFTDGSDTSYAAVIFDKDGKKHWVLGKATGTNNQNELRAVIEALKFVPVKERVLIVTDSQYVVRVCKGNFTNNNYALEQELACIKMEKTVECRWIKGHSLHVFNEEADELASFAKRLRRC